jgi:hypothetical protein
MGLRLSTIERPASKTCGWPLVHPEYQAWLTRSKIDEHRGLLRLIGHPGSGKSVLVKALAVACASKCSEHQVAKFFFDARGSADQKSMLGLLKTLLFQLLPMCAKTWSYFTNLYNLGLYRDDYDDPDSWNVRDLRDVLLRFCSVRRDIPIYIFIDAVDECEDIEGNSTDARYFAEFLQELADTSYDTGSKINICMSSRRFPAVKTRYCAEIFVDTENRTDIELYVSRELQQYGLVPSEMHKVKDSLTSKAEGVFLWARLVLSSITQSFDAGLNMEVPSVLQYLQEVPETLYKMFDQILEKLSISERLKALRLFQWAVLAQRPLSAEEWFHILAFVDEPELRSIKEWREGKYGIRDMEQLAKRLRNMTGGLLEVALQDVPQEDYHSEVVSGMKPTSHASIGSARAGSMEPYGPATFVVQFIHLSACQYFLTGNGFERLGQAAPPACFGAGHIHIAATCLRYPCLDEIDILFLGGGRSVAADSEYAPTFTNRLTSHHISSGTNLSVVSLGSSAASSSRRHTLRFPEVPARPVEAITPRERLRAPQSWFLHQWLDIVSRELDSFVPISSESDSHTGSSFDHGAQNRLVHSGHVRPPLVSNVSENLTASEAYVRLLEDPVLRLYAMEMFIHHAVEADKVGADPSELLDAIERGRDSCAGTGCWYKWCQLKDDVRSDTTPVYFAVIYNLKTWIRWYATSPSLETMLAMRGGRLRYPLLAAIFWNNESMMKLLSPHVNSEVPVRDAWMLLNHLAAVSIKAGTLSGDRRRVDGIISRLLDLNRLARAPAEELDDGAEELDDGLLLRFRNYMRPSGLGSSVLRTLLIRIAVLNEDILLYEDILWGTGGLRGDSGGESAESFLDDVFSKAGC